MDVRRKRLQGAEYATKKDELMPVAYSKTKAGNICIYYNGGFYRYLNDYEKELFQPDGLKERIR